MTLVLQADSKHEAATAYADAAHCYKKTNTKGLYGVTSITQWVLLEISQIVTPMYDHMTFKPLLLYQRTQISVASKGYHFSY